MVGRTHAWRLDALAFAKAVTDAANAGAGLGYRVRDAVPRPATSTPSLPATACDVFADAGRMPRHNLGTHEPEEIDACARALENRAARPMRKS